MLRTVYPHFDCPLDDPRPTFRWRASSGLPLGATYALILVELQERQDAGKALRSNPKIINQVGIRGNALEFPRSARPLQRGKVYAYQVTLQVPKGKSKTDLAKSEAGLFFLQPELPFALEQVACCPSNLLKAEITNWRAAYGAPQFLARQAACFNRTGLVEMSGNQEGGAAIRQSLSAADKIKKGESYQFSFCAKALPKELGHIRFRVLAYNGLLPADGKHPALSAQIALIGESGNIASVDWEHFFLMPWKAPRDYEHIAVLAIADEAAPRGAFANGMIAGLCLQKTEGCGFTAERLEVADADKLPPAVARHLDADSPVESIDVSFDQGRLLDLYGAPFDGQGNDNWYAESDECAAFGGQIEPELEQDLKDWLDGPLIEDMKPEEFTAAMQIIQKRLGSQLESPKWWPIPPAKAEECRILYDRKKPFSGRDIVYVHGFRPDHVIENIIKSDSTGYLKAAALKTGFADPDQLQEGLIKKWPQDSSEFFDGGFYKSQGEGYWKEHIPHYLGTGEELSNRYLVIAYNSSQRLEDNVHAMLMQFSLAMNEGRGVVYNPNDSRGSSCFGREYVIVIHSTGAMVANAAMAMAHLSATDPEISAFLGDASYISDRAKVHISLHGALTGSELAGLAVVSANALAIGALGTDVAVDVGIANAYVNPMSALYMLRVAFSAFGTDTDAIAAFFDEVSDSLVVLAYHAAAITNQSVLVDLTPTVAKLLWGPVFNQSPVPTLTVAGGHPGSLMSIPAQKRLLPGFDDGVVCLNSQSGSPNLLHPDRYIYLPPASRIYDMGIDAKRAGPFLFDQYISPALAAYGSIPFLSPTGMVQPIASFAAPPPRLANCFPFIQSAAEHNHPMQPDSAYVPSFGAANREETLVMGNNFIFSQELVDPEILASMRQTVRGQSLRLTWRINYPVFRAVPPGFTWRTATYSTTIPLWRRTYRLLSDGWKETDYVYRFVLRGAG